MSTLIVIPARKGSKSILSKNLKEFSGKPLIYWTIKLALEANLGPVCVSTDSEEIRDLALKQGALVPFLRPDEISQDTTSVEVVLAHAYTYFTTHGYEIDSVMLLLATSPFREMSDIYEAKDLFQLSSKITSVFSVTEAIANHNPHWMLKLNENGEITKFNGDPLIKLGTRRQDLPKVYFKNDFVFICKPETLFEEVPNLYGVNPQMLITDENRLDVDINSEKDWKIAETLFSNFMNVNS
jgi:CMP-N,N'-diacetyllegionaminic acid synthase